MRLTRLLAETEKPATAKVAPAVPAPAKPSPATSGTKDIPTIRSEEEYDALPKGSTYIDPKGNLRRKS
jgi:hypothetical protein